MYCQYCGKQIDDGFRFCDYCGKPQEEAMKAAPQDDRNSNSNKGLGAGVKVGVTICAIIAIVAISVAVAMFVLSSQDNSDNSEAQTVSAQASASASASHSADAGAGDNTAAAPMPGIVEIQNATKGDHVAMGCYAQGSNSDESAIEWVVLDVEDGHALLLSAKALDCRPINSSLSPNYDITWEKSDMRSWLNDDFLDAFTESELNSIDVTKVNSSGPEAVVTEDRVFLLSASEVSKYLPGGLASALATEYAQSQGANKVDGGAVYWWLRDYNVDREATSDDNYFLTVFSDGTINKLGYIATAKDIAVRPAMWVSLSGKGTTKSSTAETQGSSSSSSGAKKPNNPKKDAGKRKTKSKDVVSLSVKAADGTKLSGKVRRDKGGYVIADSVSREYSLSELRSLKLSDAELCIAWNEPFARQGYHFKNSGLQAYFESCDWYVDKGNSSSLSGAAAVNNERLREIADEDKSSRRWKNLAAS